MELLGGVSAAFGLAQTGFSLAKAIRETAKDYKDARDDIAGLARVIESTLSRVAEVKGLIDDNDKTKVFSDNGLITIENSFLDLERIVRELIALLTTAGVPRDTRKTIRPEDVAVTRFQKVGWIGLKSEVKDKKDELSNIQIDLTLAIICAQARSAVSPTIVAALRIRVADLEMERRQYASKGTVPGKPDMTHSSTNDSSSHSAAPIPDVSKEPPTLSPTSSGQSAVLLPGGDGDIPLGGDNKPGSTDHVPVDDAEEDTLQQDVSPTGHQQSTDTGKLTQEGTQQQWAKDGSAAHNHASDMPDTAQYAYLLVVDGMEMFVTPLLPPKHPGKLSRAKPQVTAQVWAAFSTNLRKEITATLDSMFPLPRGFGWHLASARDAATPPTWKRILARALHLYEDHDLQQSSRDGNHCYMVLFVSSRMFSNEVTSDGPSQRAPVNIQNYMHTEEDAVSPVYSGSTPRVRTLIERCSDNIARRERIPVVMPVPRRERSDSTWTDGQRRRRSRGRRDSSSASNESSRSRVRRHDRESLERGRREFVEEVRKLRKEIEIRNRADRSAIEDRHRDSGEGERRSIEREVESAPRHKSLEEEKRSLEILERRKRDETEEERRFLEDLKRRELEAKEREHQHRAGLEEMKAKEAAEKRESQKKLETAPQHQIVEVDLAPSEMEVITIPTTKDRKQWRTSDAPERTAEEETQLFNDVMLRFTGRML